MSAKDEFKAKLEMLFAAALMDNPDESEPAKAPGTTGPAASPAYSRPPLETQVGAISPYNAKSAPSPSFHGIVT